MKLKDILVNCNLLEIIGDKDLDILDIAFDSRKVKPNTLFFAVKGTQVDGHDYIDKAIEKGGNAQQLKSRTEKTVRGIQNMEKEAEEEERSMKEKMSRNAKVVADSTAYYQKNAKPGSLASKANMVAMYNDRQMEKKGKKKKNAADDAAVAAVEPAAEETVNAAETKAAETVNAAEAKAAEAVNAAEAAAAEIADAAEKQEN